MCNRGVSKHAGVTAGLAAGMVFAVALLATAADPVAKPAASNDTAGLDIVDASKWPMDVVTRNDGRTFAGMIRHEDAAQIELVEVGRRPGKPMYLLVRPIMLAEVAKIQRLSPAERETLKKRIDAFRNRTAILAAAIADVKLTPGQGEQAKMLHYSGPWFALNSTATDRVTREAIIRIEQTFAGYRTLLRPRREPPRPLGMLLFGSVAQYQDYLVAADLRIRNPAFFDSQKNLIVAGGDLASFVARLEEARAQHEGILKQLHQDDEAALQQLRDLSAALTSQGVSADKRQKVINAARNQWQERRQALQRDVRAAELENSAMYYRCFSRLYHEAFHAYLENYVFDKQRYDVPRWINEGWAQIFEAGQLDGNTLRLDAPRADLLARLTDDLRGGKPLTLNTVLTAPDYDYFVGHNAAANHASRLYLYCWGLAYDLTFRRQLLETPALDEYVRKSDSARDPVKRFERLVGKPLAVYEAEWRTAMLGLVPAAGRSSVSQIRPPAAAPLAAVAPSH